MICVQMFIRNLERRVTVSLASIDNSAVGKMLHVTLSEQV